jgi:hypothetical protein
MGVAPASRGLADAAVEDIVTYTVDREEYSLAMQQYDAWLKGICSIVYAAVIRCCACLFQFIFKRIAKARSHWQHMIMLCACSFTRRS